MATSGATNDEMMDIGGAELDNNKNEKMFTLKKWNAVAMWSWDVECDTCAICRVQVMGKHSLIF
ncbi:RING-box protein 2 [Orchesella cincta]|uniref:RING-box protein 2 n=1 Tax=Orchesella cincta TaxID=48709 RepID=A0A1D2MCL5_ORCCI|nr:RING-box protein 2 [Orchesella cincta]